MRRASVPGRRHEPSYADNSCSQTSFMSDASCPLLTRPRLEFQASQTFLHGIQRRQRDQVGGCNATDGQEAAARRRTGGQRETRTNFRFASEHLLPCKYLSVASLGPESGMWVSWHQEGTGCTCVQKEKFRLDLHQQQHISVWHTSRGGGGGCCHGATERTQLGPAWS